jgi:hypothetical protein
MITGLKEMQIRKARLIRSVGYMEFRVAMGCKSSKRVKDYGAELEKLKGELKDIYLMERFIFNLGRTFRLKPVPGVPEFKERVMGVNCRLKTVETEKYGEFGVHLCELT